MTSDLSKSYAKARSRLFLLDYDGTLTPIKAVPPLAKPTPALLRLLKKLASDSKNEIVIISGREHGNLEEWLGHLPIDISAEHGLFIKEPDRHWQQMHKPNTAWKSAIRPIMESYVQRVPNTFIEEKTATLGWHYRLADQELTLASVPELLAKLHKTAATLKLNILSGDKVIETKPIYFNKGTVARHWLQKRKWDFILTAGDDTTDEDLFKVMPSEAFTIKIGAGWSAARQQLKSPMSLRNLLKKLATDGAK